MLKRGGPRTAAVVGGGIGGLAAAAALHRPGWLVTVLERAGRFAEIGAGLSLWPNGLRALAARSGWRTGSGRWPPWRPRAECGTGPAAG